MLINARISPRHPVAGLACGGGNFVLRNSGTLFGTGRPRSPAAASPCVISGLSVTTKTEASCRLADFRDWQGRDADAAVRVAIENTTFGPSIKIGLPRGQSLFGSGSIV